MQKIVDMLKQTGGIVEDRRERRQLLQALLITTTPQRSQWIKDELLLTQGEFITLHDKEGNRIVDVAWTGAKYSIQWRLGRAAHVFVETSEEAALGRLAGLLNDAERVIQESRQRMEEATKAQELAESQRRQQLQLAAIEEGDRVVAELNKRNEARQLAEIARLEKIAVLKTAVGEV